MKVEFANLFRMNVIFFVSFAVLLVTPIFVQAIPWVAEPRPDDWWYERHEQFKQNSAINGNNISILFYGDSITEGWLDTSGPYAIYQAKYEPLGAHNYGIGGDRTEHLLYRISDGEVDNLSPKLIVLKIGTNNGADTSDDVVHGIRAVIDLLLERLPMAKILLLGVLPRSDAAAFAWIADINIKISKFHDGQKIHFLDMWDNFAVAWGQVDPVLYKTDLVHLLTPGYETWAVTMDKLFQELWNSN